MSENKPAKKAAAKKAPAKKTTKKAAVKKSGAAPKRGRPPKAKAADSDSDGFIPDIPMPSIVITANDVSKPSLRKRMLAWFKSKAV